MNELEQALQQREATHLYRRRRVLDSPQGPEIVVDGRRLLSFCSNDYLGLANHSGIVAATRNALADYGVGAGAAHLVTGHMAPHHALEEELAAFPGYPRALLFSTGYRNCLRGTLDLPFKEQLQAGPAWVGGGRSVPGINQLFSIRIRQDVKFGYRFRRSSRDALEQSPVALGHTSDGRRLK